MIKVSIHQEYIVILNVHAPNNTVAKYVKQKLRTERRNRQKHNYS